MTAKTILEGEIGAISLADLFSLFNLSKKTGTLHCQLGEVTKQVFWDEGEVVFARSSLPEDSLGWFLMTRGIITEEQYQESSSQVTAKERHGKVLVRLGHLRPEQLLWGVRNQVRDILYSLFQWESGTFEFKEGSLETREKVTVSTSTTRVVMEGIRRLDEWKRIRDTIPDPTSIPQLTGKTSGGSVPPEEKKIIDLIDGSRSFESLSRASYLGSFEAYSVMQNLLAAGKIKVTARREKPPREEKIIFKVIGKR